MTNSTTPQDCVFVELTFEDGTSARWAFEPDDSKVDELESMLTNLLGQPDTLII